MRARIALRKEGIIPPSSTDPDAEDTLIQAELKDIQKGGGKIVTENDIIAAFSRGDEVSSSIFFIFLNSPTRFISGHGYHPGDMRQI